MSDKNITFDTFVLDTEDGLLFGEGGRISIRPQAMRVLVRLATRHGQLVTRRELTAGLWADPRIDEHQGLNAIIRHLRKTLGDDPANPRFIETIPTKGYRFVAECDRVAPPKPVQSRPGRHSAVMTSLAGVVVVAAAILGWRYFDGEGSAVPAAARLAYQEGMREFRQGGILESADKFEEAVEIAPWFAEGQLMLGMSLATSQYTNLKLAEMAEPHIQEAIRLNPEMPTAYAVLGRIAMIRQLDTVEASRLARQALEMDPNNIEALILMTFVNFVQGDSYGAIDYQIRLNQIDPSRYGGKTFRGWILLWGGEYEAAARLCRESQSEDPANADATYCLFEAYLAMGSKELAKWQAVEFVRQYGAPDTEIESLESDSADDAIERFLTWRLEMADARRSGGGDPYSLILPYWRLGNEEQAIELVRQMIESRHFLSIVRLAGDERLEPLMNDPRLDDVNVLYARQGR